MIVLAALLATATPGPTAPPVPPPAGTVTATPAATVAPTPVPTLVPTPAAPPAVPAVTPVPAPAATATPYHYRFVPHLPAHPTPGEPLIYAVYLNDKQLRSLGPIDIRVETSPEVVKVVSRSNGRDGVVPLISPGVFVAVGRLPKIPFIAEGMSVDLEFIATTADGRKVVVTVPVRLN